MRTMDEAVHSIKVVANRTGLSPHVIRIWERRYKAVEPARTGTKRRVYSESEIERLTLLQKLVHQGHTIRNIAALGVDDLKILTRPDNTETISSQASGSPELGETFTKAAMTAVEKMNGTELDEILTESSIALGHQGMLAKVVCPLATQIGYAWQIGDLTAAHEHFASAAIKIFLGSVAKSFYPRPDAPLLVIGTPAGQLHSLGAIVVMASAASFGWRTTYLGPSLPAEDLAGTVRRKQAAAIALSIVYPEDDPSVNAELTRLREFLPDTPILVGGRASSAYSEALKGIEAKHIGELEDLLEALGKIHNTSEAGKA